MDEPAADGGRGASGSSAFSEAGRAGPGSWATPPDLGPLPGADGPEPLGAPLVPAGAASPRLGDELFARLLRYGTPRQTSSGDVLFRPGDQDVDLIVVVRGSVEVIRTQTAAVPAETVAQVTAGGFVGELNLMTGQNVYLLCRVREAGTIYRVPPERLRQLMSDDGELSDIIFRALIARRELLRRSTAARGVELVGRPVSAAALALRTYAARQRLIHLWFDASTPAGQAMMKSAGLAAADLPAVVMPGATLKRATPGQLAQQLNLRLPSSRPGAARAARSRSSAARTQPARPRSTWPGGAAKNSMPGWRRSSGPPWRATGGCRRQAKRDWPACVTGRCTADFADVTALSVESEALQHAGRAARSWVDRWIRNAQTT
jgi:CRP-like cAMP-binding protein